MTDSPKYVYVVFSSTQYMIAKFIRAFTHHRYNHVSIALDGNLMYNRTTEEYQTLNMLAKKSRCAGAYGGKGAGGLLL